MQANSQEKKPEGARKGREAPHEAISVASSTNFEISYNYLHNCVKEGIDVKEVSSHGSVHHNLLHDINRQALYADAWFGRLEDVSFHSNIVYNCEWGFCVSVEGKQASLENVRCFNNLIYDCRGSGISFTRFGYDLPRSEIYVYNNTISNCGIPGHWAGKVGGIDIHSRNVESVYIYNNIVYGNWGYEIASFDSTATGSELKEKNIIIENNLTGPIHDKASSLGFFKNQVYSIGSENNFIGSPDFTSPSTGNFKLGKKYPKIKATHKFKYKTDFKFLGADVSHLSETRNMVLLEVHRSE